MLQFCWQDPVLVLAEACMASMRTLERSYGYVCGSIFTAASKQLPHSGGIGTPLLCATAVDCWSAVVRRRMAPCERCLLPMDNPLGHRERGGDWKPVFNIPEGTCKVLLVDAQHGQPVPARKTNERRICKPFKRSLPW
jgi:hypothetical protein